MAGRFFAAVVEQARSAGLMSDGPFTVDDTLIDAWASMKSFQRKDTGKRKPPDAPGNPTVNFRGENHVDAPATVAGDRDYDVRRSANAARRPPQRRRVQPAPHCEAHGSADLT